jgi:hypothetical protein
VRTVIAATVSCLIGAAGIGSGYAVAGSGQKAWGCKPSWSEAKCKKHHKPPMETITLTITTPPTTVTTPPTTVTETTPTTTPETTPPVTVTTPPTTVTVTTPAPPTQTVTITTPAPPTETVTVTKTVTTPAKGSGPATHKKKKKKPGVHQVGGRTSTPPKHKGAGVTG